MKDYLATFNKSECCGCRACENLCPVNAINITYDEKGFIYPKIDTDKCINCNKCHDICEFSKEHLEQVETVESYVAKNRDEEIVEKSSSGGVFSSLSDVVLENGGIVFGTALDDEYKAVCISAKSNTERDRMRTSKYVQSDMKNTFTEIKKFLDEGVLVMFSGTPCQCAQINSLYGDYKNLIVIDFVCHGVPSPKIFEDYKMYISSFYKKKLENLNFRFKITKHSSQTMFMEFGKDIYVMPSGRDIFCRLFSGDLIFRESCYNCKYACLKRYSDITIGDFFAVKKVNPDFDNTNGVSMIMVNSKKGKQLLNSVENLEMKKSDITKVLQPQLKHPVKKPEKSDVFWNEYQNNGFKRAVQKTYGCIPQTEKIIKAEKILDAFYMLKPILKLIKKMK